MKGRNVKPLKDIAATLTNEVFIRFKIHSILVMMIPMFLPIRVCISKHKIELSKPRIPEMPPLFLKSF